VIVEQASSAKHRSFRRVVGNHRRLVDNKQRVLVVVASKAEMRVLGVVAPALVDFAVYGERTVARVCRKHLRRPSRRRQQHSLSAQCRQCCDQRSCERCFARSGISVEQKDRAVVGVGDKLAQRGNDFHLLAVGLVGKFAEYLRSDYALCLVHVCKATEKNLILKRLFGL
jgi:hypothetical protein